MQWLYVARANDFVARMWPVVAFGYDCFDYICSIDYWLQSFISVHVACWPHYWACVRDRHADE